MSELLDQINTDTNKEAISVKEITKALESGFFDTQENITTMIQELDHIDNALEHSCVQSLLKVAYTQPLYDKLQHYPELMQRLQVWSQEQYMNNLSLDEKKIGGLSLISLPKKPEDVTITTLSKYINTANTLPEHHDMLVKVLQEQMKLLNQLCPDKKSLLDMTWNSKKNGLDAPILKITTLQQLSDRIKKEAQVRKEYEAIKSTSLKQIDPGKLSKDVLKLWTITKLSTFPTELKTLDTESAFAQFLQKNQNDVFYGPILQQYVGIRLQPYIRKEGPVEYISATIDKENPELKNYVVGTTFGKKYIGETAGAYKNYKEQQQNLAKFHLTGATAEQIATFQRKRNNHQARIKPEYLKKIQDEEDRTIAQIRATSRRNSRADGGAGATAGALMAASGKVDKYIYDSVVTLTKDYVTLLLQTPEGKKLLKEKKYIDNPFMPGMRLNFAKGDVDSIVRDSFFEKFGDGIDDFKKAWEEGRREEVGRSIGSLVGGTVAAGATTILTGGTGIWAAGAAFTVGSRAGGSLGGMIGAGFEGKSWSEIGNAGLVGLGVGERDQNDKFVNYFKDAKGNVTQDSLLHGAGRMGISLGTDYLSSVATFGIGNKIGLDKWAGKFVGAGWKQFASQGAVFGAEELFIENFLVDIPANTLQAGVSSFFLGNAIQDVGPRSAKLSQNTNTNKQIDPNNPTATQWDVKAALGAMSTTFSQNISPENLGQTFAATLAYGGMLSGGRSAINKVAVALPALSVKNINEISTSYQTQLTDLQTKFPTLSIGKDMNTLTLDGKVLDQTHARFGELEGSLKALQVLGKSFTEEMDKISQIQQGLIDPDSPEAKKRGLIYGWKLLHPRMTPLEVMSGRIDKLKKEIATEKNPAIKSQKEVLLQQMESGKGELEGKNNKTEKDDQPQESKKNVDLQNSQIEINNIDDKKGEIYLKIGPIKVNKTILSTQHKELLHKIPGAKDMVLGSNILDLHRGETNDASQIKSGFKALQEKLLQAKNNGEELPSHILGLSNLSFVLGKYGFSILDTLPVEVYTQVGQYKRLFGEVDLNNPLTEAEMKQKERIGQNNDGKNPIKIAIIDVESFLKLDFGKKGKGSRNELQELEPANVNNLESVNKSLEELVTLIPTETLRRPNGSIGTQGFTEENFISVARHIAQEMNFTIPDYDKTSSVSEITQLIQYLKNNKEAHQKIKEYVIKDPVIVSLLPDNTYHIEDGNHRANLLNLIGVDVIPAIERNGRNIQDIINEHNAKVEKIEGRKTREVNENTGNNSNQGTIESTQNIQPLLTIYPDILKNIVNPEILQNIIQSEMAAGNLILNTDGSIKEVYTEVGGEKKPSQLFEKMKADGFSEQQALKTWLQVRTPEFNNRFGDRQNTDKSQVSKVVDENGEPLMVYHGSRTDIQDGIFKLPKDLEQTKTPMEGISTTSSKQVAIDYANKYHLGFEGGNIYPLFVNIKNSVSLNYVGEYNSYMKYLRKTEGLSEKYNIKSYAELKVFEEHMANNTNEYLSQDEVNYKGNIFTKEEFIELWSRGFDLLLFVPNNKDNISGLKNPIDGITFNPHIDGNFSAATSIPYDQQLVFDPKNLKSAIDNDGSFSPETAKFNDYFGKESRFGFDSKQARDHSTFMDQFSGQATVEQIAQIRQKIDIVAEMYTDKTGKKLELTDTQIQAIIDTHLLPGQLGQLTQAELLTKNKKLAETIPDADVRRFLLEAGFCGMFDFITERVNQINYRSKIKDDIEIQIALDELDRCKGKSFEELRDNILNSHISPFLSLIYDSSVGVPDIGHETLRSHTNLVLEEFEQIARSYETHGMTRYSGQLPPQYKDLLGKILLIHDIPKVFSIKLGLGKDHQHDISKIIIPDILNKLGMTGNEGQVAQFILTNDSIGKHAQGMLTKKEFDSYQQQLLKLSQNTGLSTQEIYGLQLWYYRCDAGSYDFLKPIFGFDEGNRSDKLLINNKISNVFESFFDEFIHYESTAQFHMGENFNKLLPERGLRVTLDYLNYVDGLSHEDKKNLFRMILLDGIRLEGDPPKTMFFSDMDYYKQALDLYTQDYYRGYNVINRLGKEQACNENPKLSVNNPEVVPLGDYFLKLGFQNHIYETYKQNKILYRDFDIMKDNHDLLTYIMGLQEGNTYVDKGYFSTSLTAKNAYSFSDFHYDKNNQVDKTKRFATEDDHRHIKVVITSSHSGVDIDQYSTSHHKQTEKEILFAPNTPWSVLRKKVDEKSKSITLIVKEQGI